MTENVVCGLMGVQSGASPLSPLSCPVPSVLPLECILAHISLVSSVEVPAEQDWPVRYANDGMVCAPQYHVNVADTDVGHRVSHVGAGCTRIIDVVPTQVNGGCLTRADYTVEINTVSNRIIVFGGRGIPILPITLNIFWRGQEY